MSLKQFFTRNPFTGLLWPLVYGSTLFLTLFLSETNHSTSPSSRHWYPSHSFLLFYRNYKSLHNNYNTVLEPILHKKLSSRLTLAFGKPRFFTSASFGTILMVRRSSTKLSLLPTNLVTPLSWTTYTKKLSTLAHQPSMTMEIYSPSSPLLAPKLTVCYPSLRWYMLTLSKTKFLSSWMFLFIVISNTNLSKMRLHKW